MAGKEIEYISKHSGLTEEEAEACDCVVCPRIADKTIPGVPDAYQDECALCDAHIWVSPRSPKTPPRWCIPCAISYEESLN